MQRLSPGARVSACLEQHGDELPSPRRHQSIAAVNRAGLTAEVSLRLSRIPVTRHGFAMAMLTLCAQWPVSRHAYASIDARYVSAGVGWLGEHAHKSGAA